MTRVQLFITSLFGCVLLHGQQPDTVSIFKITVNPFGNNDSIIWHHATGIQPDYYEIGIVGCSNCAVDPHFFVPIDTVFYPDSVFVNSITQSAIRSVGYSVRAHRGGIDGPWHNPPDSTIFHTASYDSCLNSIHLEWTLYNAWRGQISRYEIIQSLAGEFMYQVIPAGNENIRTMLIKEVARNTEYQYFVKAYHNDGIRYTYSNLTTTNTRSLVPAGWVELLRVEDEGGSPAIYFRSDPLGKSGYFRLLRSNTAIGPYDTIRDFEVTSNSGSVTDPGIAYSAGVFYYKVLALNSCNQASAASTPLNNVLLAGQAEGTNHYLHWNPVEDWLQPGLQGIIYQWYSADPSIADSVAITSQLSAVFETQTLMSLLPQDATGALCYQTTYSLAGTGGGDDYHASSNIVCIDLPMDILFPNAIIPDNPEPVNQEFKPIFLSGSQPYELTIYNRWGNRVWAGTGPWNGKSGDNYLPEGVYLYHVKVSSDNGKSREFTGTVTVIHNR